MALITRNTYTKVPSSVFIDGKRQVWLARELFPESFIVEGDSVKESPKNDNILPVTKVMF